MDNLFLKSLAEVTFSESERRADKKKHDVNIANDKLVVMSWQLVFLALPVQTNRWQIRLAWFHHQRAQQCTC